MDGVTNTRSGWIDRHEVVIVEYRPAVVAYEALLESAKEQGCASHVWATTAAQLETAREVLGDRARELDGEPRDAKASDQLYYLRNSVLGYLPLTPLQARRVNGALYTKRDPGRWLSPRQTDLRERIEKTLAADSQALAELKRPSEIDQLDEYTEKLEAALEPSDR